MRLPRIAIIGDTHVRSGSLTGAGAIALELARGWQGKVDVGFRSVADSPDAWDHLDTRFGAFGVTTWLTVRDTPTNSESPAASVVMGDRLNIDELFGHDLVIVAMRDTNLRRFLADLPVHTYPNVRMLALIHFADGLPEGEHLADLTRFDMLIGSELDFFGLVEPEDAPSGNSLERVAPAIRGSNVRAAISWGKHGAFRCLTQSDPILTIPAHHAPTTESDAPWAAFVAAVAMGIVQRATWREVGHDASRRFAIRAQELRIDHRVK